jgi:Sap, sulfolipid-1-addressing protein
MFSAAFHLIPYALLATLSPIGFAATVTVMRTGRLKALGFAVGVVVGQLLMCTILVVVGVAARPDRSTAHPTVEGLLELGLAVVLLSYAVVVRRRPETERRTSSGRAKAALERLQHVHVVTATGVGLLLGIGGPKRLVLTALAAASITAAGLEGSKDAALIGWYGLLATVLVWLPVLGYLLLGNRAVGTLDAAIEWLDRNRRPAIFYGLVIVSLVLLVNAASLLF